MDTIDQQPKQVPLTPEVQGYIQGLKDIVAVQNNMIAQRSAEIFGLRTQVAELLRKTVARSKHQTSENNPVTE